MGPYEIQFQDLGGLAVNQLCGSPCTRLCKLLSTRILPDSTASQFCALKTARSVRSRHVPLPFSLVLGLPDDPARPNRRNHLHSPHRLPW